MNSILRISLLSCLCCLLAGSAAHAQEFKITHIELAGEEVFVFYDLVDSTKGRHFTINMYASTDNYINPLTKVSGDAGLEVAPGLNKKMIWKAKEEMPAGFEGHVGLKIRGKVFHPFIRFNKFEDIKTWKRGVPVHLTWTGGTSRNILTFDLYQGKKKVWTQPGVGNTGNHKITIPKHIKPGKNYHFVVSDSKNKDEVVRTSAFTLKRKIPLALKAGVVAGVGYLIIHFWPKGGGSDPLPNALCPQGDNSCNE